MERYRQIHAQKETQMSSSLFQQNLEHQQNSYSYQKLYAIIDQYEDAPALPEPPSIRKKQQKAICGCGARYTCSSSLSVHIKSKHYGRPPPGTIGLADNFRNIFEPQAYLSLDEEKEPQKQPSVVSKKQRNNKKTPLIEFKDKEIKIVSKPPKRPYQYHTQANIKPKPISPFSGQAFRGIKISTVMRDIKLQAQASGFQSTGVMNLNPNSCYCGAEFHEQIFLNEHVKEFHPQILYTNAPMPQNNAENSNKPAQNRQSKADYQFGLNQSHFESQYFSSLIQKQNMIADLINKQINKYDPDNFENQQRLYNLPAVIASHYQQKQMARPYGKRRGSNPRRKRLDGQKKQYISKRIYMCGQCLFVYAFQQELTLHLKKTHKGEIPDGTIYGVKKQTLLKYFGIPFEKPPIKQKSSYQCGCGKSYSCYPSLNYHIKTVHSGVEPVGTIGGLITLNL